MLPEKNNIPIMEALPDRRRFGVMTVLVTIVILVDQFTKWQVSRGMRLHESIAIIPDMFNLTYIRNSGAAFGILSGSQAGFRMVFFGVTSILALFLLGTIYARLSAGDRIGQASVALVFGGALGNLIDRVRIGEVIDFLDFYFIGPDVDFYIGRYHLVYIGPYHWPAFNVADTAITIGVGLLIGHFFLQKDEGPAQTRAS